MDQGQNTSDGEQSSFAAIKAIIVCVLMLMMPLLFVDFTFARTATSVEKSIVNKVLAQGVYRCYDNGFVVSSFDTIEEKYNGISSFVNQNGNEWDVPLITGLDSSSFASTAKYRLGGSGGLSCKEYFAGSWDNSDLLTATNHNAPSKSQPAEVIEFLENMGYSVVDVSSGGGDKCYSLKYKVDKYGDNEYYTNLVCQSAQNGELRVEGANNNTGVLGIRFDVGGKKNEICLHTPNGLDSTNRGCRTLGDGETFDGGWLQGLVGRSCNEDGAICHVVLEAPAEGYITYVITFVGDDGGGVVQSDSLSSKKASFINGNARQAGMKAVEYLYNMESTPSTNDLSLNRVETRLLYQDYLTSYYNVQINCNTSDAGFYDTQNPIWWYDKSSKAMKQCYYGTSKAKNASKPVNGVSGGWIQYEKIKNLDELLAVFTSDELGHEYSEEELAQLGSMASEESFDNTMEGKNGDNVCYDGSGNLGWLICPVVKMVSGIGEYMWGVIEENLQIPAEGLFKNTTGVRDAWDAIRNIANVVFVILFLFVIFSQLTGIGIDNYGIKRILPKLILVAILINLSYIICEVVIDLSNILGMGLNSLLADQASKIPVPDAMSTGEVVSGWVVDTVIAGGGVTLFLLLNPAGAIVAAAGLGLAVLGLLITTVVSIFFMYATLVVRQAGVILMVVLAPIALACYMLPNTEKLFKKWFDLFKALLIVYPICGALIGAGQLAGAVLASINTPSMRVAAMLVQVVPFFLLPMIIRNSLSLMGNIGNRLAGWGRTLGRRGSNFAQGQIRNSKQFQDWQKRQTAEAGVRRARRLQRRNDWRVDRGLGEKEREELRGLRQRIRAGENLSPTDKRRYDELVGRSKYKPSDSWQKRLSDANATIRESEANREKARIGSNEAVLAGQIQSDRYMNEKAAEEATDWNEQYFVDNDNNEWVSDGKGNYVTSVNGVKQTKTAAEVAAMVGEKQGVMVSRREAMLHRDAVMRARQAAQIAGYANERKTDMAASGARISSVEASRAEVARDTLSGDDNVLRVQHDENVAKLRETMGRAEARGALTGSPVASTEVYARKAANEYNLAQAGNRIEVTPEITRQYAESLATQRFNTSQERMYSEQLVNNSRAQSLADLAGAIRGDDVLAYGVKGSSTGVGHVGDINYIMAAVKDVVAKGGVEDLNNLIKNAGPEISSNSKVARAIGGYMATMSVEPAMKAYGKSIANIPEGDVIPSYKYWLNAADDSVRDPDGKLSLAGFIRANGNTVLVNASKDTAKFYNADPVLMDKFSMVQIWNGMLSARDNETRNAFNAMLANKIEHGTAQDGTTGDAAKNKIRQEAIDAASNAQWANIEESSFKALLGLSESDDLGTAFARLDPVLQKSLRDAKARLDKAGGTVKANMRGKVREFFDSVK